MGLVLVGLVLVGLVLVGLVLVGDAEVVFLGLVVLLVVLFDALVLGFGLDSVDKVIESAGCYLFGLIVRQ